LIKDLEDYKKEAYPFAESFEKPIKILLKVNIGFDDFFTRLKELEDELRTAEAPISLSFFGKSKKASNLQQNSKSDNEKSKE
jgi:polysaccharide deacetylase 2 family uncharacterized protein YibQ